MQRLVDLREMLRYVPQYRDKIFVIAFDGAAVEHDNFRNLLLDLALLRSIRIGVVLVHGAGHQIRKLAADTSHVPSNFKVPTSAAVMMPSFSVGGVSPRFHASIVDCAPAKASPLRCIGFRRKIGRFGFSNPGGVSDVLASFTPATPRPSPPAARKSSERKKS